ncbi:MAG: CPBP family intramembrane metalloprotease [Lachnospiraceae bacterium]|nr:CPBP family intramembrane metalloprotease [Lachnospiraceae bacterium]MBQ9234573.1 CPBP family intramembrane metalloprotease [Lachnospiraceae bacterium]
MESNNRTRNIINIFVPCVIAMLLQVVTVFGDIVAIFIKNCVSNEKTVASRTIETIMSQDYNQPMNKAVISAVQFILYILVFGLWYYKLKKPSVKEGFFGIIKPPIIIFLITAGIAGQFFVDSILSLIRPVFKSAFSAYDDLVENVTGVSSSWLMLVAVFLLAPIAEEILFRGLTLTYAKRCMPVTLAIIIQALIFGVYHGNIIQGIYAFLLGMLIGFLVHKTDNLLAGIVFHIALNVSIMAVPRGLFSSMTSRILTVCISTVILAVSVILVFKIKRKGKQI